MLAKPVLLPAHRLQKSVDVPETPSNVLIRSQPASLRDCLCHLAEHRSRQRSLDLFGGPRVSQIEYLPSSIRIHEVPQTPQQRFSAPGSAHQCVVIFSSTFDIVSLRPFSQKIDRLFEPELVHQCQSPPPVIWGLGLRFWFQSDLVLAPPIDGFHSPQFESRP